MNEENKKNVGQNEDGEDVKDQNSQGGAGKDSGDDGGKGGSSNDGGAAGGKSFTQDQVTKMMTREKQQGRNAALNELGINPKDQKQLDAIKAYIKSQKTDEQLAAEKDMASEKAIAEANQRVMIAEAKAEAMMIGVKAQFVEDAVTLALSKVGTDGVDKDAIKTALGELKTKYPIWFEADDGDDKDGKGAAQKKTGQKGTGSSVKADKSKDKATGDDNKSMGARLAAQRKGSGQKKSFWG